MRKTLIKTMVLVSALACTQAQAQLKVGVISSSTGPVSMIGIPQKNSVQLLPSKIAGQSVQYLTLDDASDPTATVVAVKKLIAEDNVDAIIGPSGSPNAMGVIQFVAEAGVPLLAPVGTASVVLPMNEQKKWVFKTTQNDSLIASALVEHMAKTGVKTVGFIGTSDPYGENWAKVFGEIAAQHGINVVANERFQRQDASVTAQAIKLIAAKPDAVLVAAPGAPAVLPQVTLVDRGYRGKFYQTHGAALPDFLKLGGKKVEGTILAASLMLVLNEVPDAHPSKKVAANYVANYEKQFGAAPATFGGNVFDAGLLLEKAVPTALAKAKPGTKPFRAALRDALEQLKEVPGTQGVYNMTAADHSGFDERGRQLITVSNGNWSLVR